MSGRGPFEPARCHGCGALFALERPEWTLCLRCRTVFAELDHYQRGYQDGRDDGYRAGYDSGYEVAWRELEADREPGEEW